MYKAFGFLFLVVLFSCSSGQTIGQVTRNESRPADEAKRLLQEGIELTESGQLPQAVSALEEAVKLDPQYAEAYSALGRAYFKMRQWRRAVDNLHRATALNAKQREAETAVQQQPPSQQQPTPAAPSPQIKATASILQPEKQPGVAVKLTPTPSPQIPKSEPRDVKTEAPVPSTPEMKMNAVEVTPRTSPEVTQAEKTTGEVSPLKSEAISAPEEKQVPTGATVSMSAVSMSAPPVSSRVESGGVSPIPLKPSNEDVSLTKIYRVGPGDVLDVRIDEAQQGQSTLFTVTATGLLEHPMLAEPLNVSTLTTEEIGTKIQEDLKKRAVIEDPKVTVGVRDYASHTVLVSGLVKDAGTKILRREAIPLYVVVADAQPLPEAARVTVVRNEQSQMFEIDLTEVADMGMLVRPGDVINLLPNETQFIYVGGEVKAPGEKIFRRGLTLTQAIISAGGVTPKSKVAEIGRDNGQGFLVRTTFNLQDIQTGKAMDPLIRPGDRIMILR